MTAEPHTRLRYFCSPQHEDSAFFPIIGQLERAAGFAHEDDSQSKLDKLDVVLAATATSREDAALIADLLSLPDDGRHPTLTLAPAQRRQKTMEALGTQIDTLTRMRSVLMIFEDAHWADPSSLELLGRIVDRIERVRVLMLVTARPEFVAPWIGRPNVTAMTISRLTQTEVVALIDRVVGNKALAANVRNDIVERADGVPLFVEEMTKAVLESDEIERTMTTIPSRASAVPATLHATLMARLDRLGDAKWVAQIGAAIGREFSHGLIAAVFQGADADLERALERLMDAGLVTQQGVEPRITYLFKHALVQDAAYGTLLREPRRALHARITGALENQFPEIASSYPEILARHCSESGLHAKAADIWGIAGNRSLERSALAEATEQLARALVLLEGLPQTAACLQKQLQLQSVRITVLMHLRGYANPDTKEALQIAQRTINNINTLGARPEDPLLLTSLLYGFWTASYVGFCAPDMHRYANELVNLSRVTEDSGTKLMALRIHANTKMFTGDLEGSLKDFDDALAIYNPTVHRTLATRFGQDAKVSALISRSYTMWMLGFPDSALSDVSNAMNEANEVKQAATFMFAFAHASWTYFQRGDYKVALESDRELVRLAKEKGSFWEAAGVMNQGRVMLMTSDAASASRQLEEGLDKWMATGTKGWVPLYLAHLAAAYAKLGDLNKT